MADEVKSENAKPDRAAVEARKQQQAEDGKKAMSDYEAAAAAERAKTERLRALRLARDAAMPPAPAKTRAASGKKPAKAAKGSKAKPRPLAEWLDEQRKDGRRD
jgi:hypothetical protein